MQGDGSSQNVSGEDVQAWIDGELSVLDAAHVQAAVKTDPELSALANAIRKQNKLMRSLHLKNSLDSTAGEDSIRTEKPTTAEHTKTELVRKPFAYAAAALIGFGIGWFAQDWVQRKTVEANWDNEALQVYDFLTEDSFWSVDFGAKDIAAFETVAQNLFGRKLPIPDLNERQFNYHGAKVLPAWDGSSIHLIYRDPSKRLVTVTFSSGKSLGSRFRPRVINFEGLKVQTRQVGEFGVSISAPANDDTLDYVSAKVFSVFR